AKAGVSIASISRFAKAIGCEDIRDLKLKLAQASAVGRRFLTDETAPEDNAFYNRICSEVEANLRTNLGRCVEADFRAAAARLNQARLMYVGGMGGGSTMLAAEPPARMSCLGTAVTAYRHPFLLRRLAATLPAEHVLVLLSVTGVSRELSEVAS